VIAQRYKDTKEPSTAFYCPLTITNKLKRARPGITIALLHKGRDRSVAPYASGVSTDIERSSYQGPSMQNPEPKNISRAEISPKYRLFRIPIR
jgi:hypothetical protein